MLGRHLPMQLGNNYEATWNTCSNFDVVVRVRCRWRVQQWSRLLFVAGLYRNPADRGGAVPGF